MDKKEDVALITKDGIRHDGRKREDLRNIKFELGVLDRADGSALITWGKNKILAAVYGPRELHPKHMALPDRALIRCEYRMATFSVSERKSPAPKRREKEISKILGEALEPAIFDYLYPRSVIDIFVEVLQADGGSRCASVTVAALALADAGIPMRDLAVGCAAGNIDGHVILDLDDVEDKEGAGDLPIAYLPNLDKIVLLQSDGEFTPEQYKEALDMLIPACKNIYQMQREAIASKYSRITADVETELEEHIIAEKIVEPLEKVEKDEKIELKLEQPNIEDQTKEEKKKDSSKQKNKKDDKKKDQKKPSSKNKEEKKE